MQLAPPEETVIHAEGHAVAAGQYRQTLVTWGRQHCRDLPWRRTRDPFHVLVAEILLHRTRALQVVPVYEELVEKYPTVTDLADAPVDTLREMLYSLGLRWRVDLLHQMATELTVRHGGKVPLDVELLGSLPGVSHYIACATTCFAGDAPAAIADTNTVRVVGRLFGLRTNDGTRRNKRFRRLLDELLDEENPRAYNLALLDLAEAICTPRKPDHERCPLREFCRTARSTAVETETPDLLDGADTI